MPRVSEFFGIVIYVYHDDHPPPHFHVHYAEFAVEIRIDDLSVVKGKLPPRALGLVMEWAALHQEELANVWKQAEAKQPLSKIAPLE